MKLQVRNPFKKTFMQKVKSKASARLVDATVEFGFQAAALTIAAIGTGIISSMKKGEDHEKPIS